MIDTGVDGGANPFGSWTKLDLAGKAGRIADLGAFSRAANRDLTRLPYSVRVLLENALRHCGRGVVQESDVLAVADWDALAATGPEFAFMPARVLLQDFTGVPCVVDLAALRSALARLGRNPAVINPSVPVDLVIDHSVQVDFACVADACQCNMQLEMDRNAERYALLRWAQGEFSNLRVVPPGAGIVHQVNLEYLADVVRLDAASVEPWVYPDTVVGTDSHTTMINGLGVLGWGVGGIEAEAVMLGQPYFMLVPQVVGVRLKGSLPIGATATDLVLTVTQLLRGVGVVGRFVEYFGAGAESLTLADRATLANMAPEYGATCGFFAVDGTTIDYLRSTGRPAELCARVEAYCRAQGLFRTDESPEPGFSQVVELDLADVRPSLAGPRRPQDRVPLEAMSERFRESLPDLAQGRTEITEAEVELDSGKSVVRDGAVVIASITSCTNTSNPILMLGAGVLARNAVRRGLSRPAWVRTSLAPGSRAVTGYLTRAGLLPYLEQLGFDVVGYGCATCIGNSGPLQPGLERAVREQKLVLAAVLSGNRNFEARIHPLVRANYLASPPLVVAYALAGTVDIDLTNEPLGCDTQGTPVYLRDLWPSAAELEELAHAALGPDLFVQEYAMALEGSEAWREMAVPTGALFRWDPESTYVQEPPFFNGFTPEPAHLVDLLGARILAILGDSVTTDHISPAGSISPDSPAGRFLMEHGVQPCDFNTYGSRRGNHEVLMRGTFANVRLRNAMAGGREGGWTVHHPTGEMMTIYDAACRYQAEGVASVVFAGKEYGTGSSRDWAAKGPALLGVRAVVAESFERIHRSNLVGMGVLPLELEPGTTVESLALDGSEVVDIQGIRQGLGRGSAVTVWVRRAGSAGGVVAAGAEADAGPGLTVDPEPDTQRSFVCRARLDSSVDVEYFRHGGVLPRVLRLKLGESGL